MSKDADNPKKFHSWIFWLILLLAIIFWFLSLIEWFPWWVTKDRGQFGDSFGVINTLFSALALGGVIYAILLQQEELGLQREELKNTREEMEGQKLATRKQNFESSFFQLLKMLDAKYNSTKIPHDIRFDPEEEDFETAYKRVRESDDFGRYDYIYNVRPRDGDYVRAILKGDDAFVKAVLDRESFSVNMYVNPYFSLLFAACRFIDESDFTKNFEEKKGYTDILRGQMKDYEVILLCMLAAYPEGWWLGDRNDSNMESKIFKELIEKYSLLSDINIHDDWKEYIARYNRSAFGNNRPDIDKILKQNQRGE